MGQISKFREFQDNAQACVLSQRRNEREDKRNILKHEEADHGKRNGQL